MSGRDAPLAQRVPEDLMVFLELQALAQSIVVKRMALPTEQAKALSEPAPE